MIIPIAGYRFRYLAAKKICKVGWVSKTIPNNREICFLSYIGVENDTQQPRDGSYNNHGYRK